jgi:adenylyltransferase/sulfurtransferase
VLGVLPGTIGTLQATEALKLILGAGTSSAGGCCSTTRSTDLHTITLPKRASCLACGDNPTVTRAD